MDILKVGKLDSDILEKIVFGNIRYKSADVIKRAGLGEAPEVCNLVDMMLTAIPAGADVGVFTFDRDGVHEVVPFRKIADGPNGGGVLPENAIIRDGLSMETQNKLRTLLRPQDTQTGIDIPLYDVLSDAIDRLQAYMDGRQIGRASCRERV